MDHDTHCISKTLKILGRKWTGLILLALFQGKKRFGELQKKAEGITPKTLSHRLDELEVEGIIHKRVFAEVPLHVEYTLTEKGKSLQDVFEKMRIWGETH